MPRCFLSSVVHIPQLMSKDSSVFRRSGQPSLLGFITRTSSSDKVDRTSIIPLTGGDPSISPSVNKVQCVSTLDLTTDNVHKIICPDEPFHPPDTFIFPTREISNKPRSCQHSWFTNFPFLHYVQENDTIVCWHCLKATSDGLIKGSERQDLAFLKGFSNWKKGVGKITDHAKTMVHRDCTERITLRGSASIVSLLNKQFAADQEKARYALRIIFSSIRFLGSNNLALTGDTSVQGNFYELVYERAEEAGIQDWIKRRNNWMSVDIQNEIVELFACAIQKEIVSQSQGFPLGLIADGTTDVSKFEQFSISIRVCRDLEPKEYFLGFYNPPDSTSETLFKVIRDVFIRLNLDMRYLMYFCFDGAANMSGHISGLQARLREQCPGAMYIHCVNHSLNLALQEIGRQIQLVADAMQWVKDVHIILGESAQRKALFTSLFGGKPVVSLKGLCPTRWCMRTKAFQSALANYKEILEALSELEHCKSGCCNTRAKVKGLLKQGRKAATYFALMVCYRIFSPCEKVAKSLQSLHVTAKGALESSRILISTLTAMRTMEAAQVSFLFFPTIFIM